MKPKLTISNILLLSITILGFWYAKYCYEIGEIGLRGTKWHLDKSPGLFWLGEVFVCGVALYSCYLLLTGE